MKKKIIFVFDAEPGMTLSSDIYLSDGSLLAAKGTHLDLTLIAKISDHHILEIEIYDVPAFVEPVDKPAESTYFDKVRESEKFKDFCTDYNKGVDQLKSQLNDIVLRNTPIDEFSLMFQVNTLMSKFNNRLQMFDMLHSLRQFDDLTYVHSINVALVASIIGQWLHFSEEDIKILTMAGLLHDIGKVNIPDEILNKPGKLTPEEFAIMKSHVNSGYDLLKNQNIDPRIKEACLLHHEKCDGTGYPFNLTTERIPAFAKIISVADIYDAMTADRVYRQALCPFTVINMMENQCFSTLDPTYCLPFLKNVVSSYIHNNVRLSDGRIGEVILINDRALSKPSIMVGNEFIDLSKSPLTITAIL